MPEPIFLKTDLDQVGTVTERVIGRRRSTNTWIPTTSFGARLSVLRNHSERLLSLFRAIHAQAHPEAPKMSDEDLRLRYSCIASYRGLHQELVEHLGSHKGFLVKQVMGNPEEPDQDRPKDSTAGAAAPAPAPAPATNGAIAQPGMQMR